jgi:exopolysaccharide production protein ExoZ
MRWRGGGGVPEDKLTFTRVVTSTLLFPQTGYAFLDVSWTLCYEMFFYSIFLMVILYGPALRWFCLIHAAMCLVACLILQVSPHDPDSFPVNFLFNGHLLEFYAGCVIAWFYSDVSRTIRRWSAALCLAAGTAILAADGWNQYWLMYHLSSEPLFWGAGMALVIVGLIPLERAGVLRVPLWLVFLGDASYSIYLAHTSIMHVLRTGLTRTGFDLAAHPHLSIG